MFPGSCNRIGPVAVPRAVPRNRVGSIVHEMSIVQSLIDQVEAELDKAGHAGRVRVVDLVVGRLSGANADSIRFAYQVLAPGTILEGAELQIHLTQAVLHCRSCGAQRQVAELEIRCGSCGSSDTTIQGGQELLLQSIELED
jgi:hydrogenase nickel incorporation protein HypA/HybF